MKFNNTLKCLLAILFIAAIVHESNAQTITSNQTGNQGGYWYTFWKDNPGSVSMTLGSGGQFSVSWSNVGNFVCGKGWSTGSESRTITYSRSGSAQYIGVYGWMTNPLVEYYIGQHSGGSRRGTYSADGTTYTLYIDNRNGPNIQGNGPFMQYNAVGGGTTVNFGQHTNGWRSLGASVGSQNYQVVAIEGWNSSGNASATVGSGGSSSGGSSSGGSSSGGSSSGGSYQVSIRMRGTAGGEHVVCRVGSTQIGSWTLGTSFNTYQATTTASGGITVCFDNDGGSRDVQVDCIWLPNGQFQAESQSYNTGVWQNGSCGGSNSEWLHCNGCIGFSGYRKTAGEEAESPAALPEKFFLEQNYPNPFNPSTVIQFGIPENSYVSLKVFNSLGQEVTELAGREYSAGIYKLPFDASNLANGIYFYVMKAGNYSVSRKMILLK